MCMKEAVSRISTYSADTFGVCSSLYELGGMIVIHDPSGCNSTYATHDEPRWYDQDSLIFISGVTEMDAIMGNDDKFVHDVISAARDFSPRFIVILCTPVPLMMGTDMEALAALIEDQTGIPTMASATNNMNLYDKGIAWAMEMLARRIVRNVPVPASAGPMCCSWQPEFAACGGTGNSAKRLKVNIIGTTPLDFSCNGSDRSIKKFLRRSGFSVCSTWAMGSPLEEIEMAGLADVNLVVSAGAVEGAAIMKERFGMPYVVGVPIGSYMQEQIAEGLRRAVETKQDMYVCADSRTARDCDTIIIGESVYAASLAAALEPEGRGAQVYCPLNVWDGVLLSRDRTISSEGELRQLLSSWTGVIIADPLYKPVCPDMARFVPLGHTAFSGRLYQKDIPNLIDEFAAFAGKI